MTDMTDAPPCECDVLRVKTCGVFWCRAVVTFMCRSVAWDRGESRWSPVLVVARHPLLGGTTEIPLADLTQPLRVVSPTPRQERRHIWSITLGTSRRTLNLRASSTAQYAKWTRLTREWLQLGHDMSASVATASPTATPASDVTSAYRWHRHYSRAFAHWSLESKPVAASSVPWTLEMLPSPLSSPPCSARSESSMHFAATTDPAVSRHRLERDSDATESHESGGYQGGDDPLETGGGSRSVFSLLQALQAQDASLETLSSGMSSVEALSIGPLSESTTDGGVDESIDWGHPTGRAASSASLSSWLSANEAEDNAGGSISHSRYTPVTAAAELELELELEPTGGRASEDAGGADERESFDYEAAFPWVFTDAPDRRVVVMTGPRPAGGGGRGGGAQTIYFF